jgi:hypothetical protein
MGQIKEMRQTEIQHTSEGSTVLRRQWHAWGDNIKTDLRYVKSEAWPAVDWYSGHVDLLDNQQLLKQHAAARTRRNIKTRATDKDSNRPTYCSRRSGPQC